MTVKRDVIDNVMSKDRISKSWGREIDFVMVQLNLDLIYMATPPPLLARNKLEPFI